jgi:hypothetical protein
VRKLGRRCRRTAAPSRLRRRALLFENDPTGGYGEDRWSALIEDIRVNELKWAILILKEADGRVGIHEGNHRLRAAVAARLARVPVQIRYFGNSQRAGLMRLVLSLYNGPDSSFSIPVCTQDRDETRLEWAKAIILDYFDRGE